MEINEREQWVLLLKSLPFFEEFSENELEEMLGVYEIMKYKPYEIIISEVSDSDSVYILLKGEAIVEKKAKSQSVTFKVGTLEKGASFGVAGLFLKKPCSASVRAVNNVYLFKICTEDIDQLKPEIGRKFYRHLAMDIFERLNESNAIVVG